MVRENGNIIIGCRFCGIVDEITGCCHTRTANYADPGIPVLLGPGGTFLVDSAASVSIPIDRATGLHITKRRW